MENKEKELVSKYHRKKPVKEFDVNQTLYSLVKRENVNNKKMNSIGFLGSNMTYGDLFESVDKLADAYIKSGVKSGDVVGICSISMPSVQQNLLALSKIGAVSKWIDLRTKEKDLIKNLNESNCKIMVIFEEITPMIEKIINETNLEKVLMSSPKDFLNPVIRILANIKDKNDGKYIEVPSDKRFMRLTDFINSGSISSNIIPARFEKDKSSLIIQSSGSTGKPKSIVHTDYNFNSAVQKLGYTDLPFGKGKTLFVAVPPFIIYGLNNSIYSSLVFEMKAEMTPFVSETTVYDNLGKFDIPFAAPLHYRYLYTKVKELTSRISELEIKNDSLSKRELKKSLKELMTILKHIHNTDVLVSGGDKMTAEELIEMQQEFDKIIVNGYGNNEVVGAAVVSPRYANKPGSIGVPMRGIEAEVFDTETGKMLKQGEMGELCLATDNAFVEYLNNEEETEKIKQFHDDKYWVHTGDLAIIDEDGYINLKGRNRRTIYKEAFKICPDTIENIIQELPYVRNCVVVGVDDKVSNSVPMAFIELESEFKNQESVYLDLIRQVCEQELPDYEVPSYYQIIDKIPYTQNNKQDFRKLEEIGNEYVINVKRRVLK